MIEALIAGLFGLLIGSFLNVCIYRMPRDLSVVHPRSRCPHCETTISWYDNVPLLSWLALRARCRRCGGSIPFRYPLVEFLTGLLFVAGFVIFGPTVAALKFCVFAAIQICLLFMDLEERILADEFTLGGTLAGLAFAFAVPPAGGILSLLVGGEMNPAVVALLESASSAAFLAITLWVIGYLYQKLRGREGLGFGDVKLVACIGAFLGLSPALLAIAGGSVLGLIFGVLYIRLKGEDISSYELPFGSFLCIGALVVAMLRPGEYVI